MCSSRCGAGGPAFGRFLISGGAPLSFQGCGFSDPRFVFPAADSDPTFHRARRVRRGRKTRTLHKSGEECGTRKFNQPSQSACGIDETADCGGCCRRHSGVLSF